MNHHTEANIAGTLNPAYAARMALVQELLAVIDGHALGNGIGQQTYGKSPLAEAFAQSQVPKGPAPVTLLTMLGTLHEELISAHEAISELEKRMQCVLEIKEDELTGGGPSPIPVQCSIGFHVRDLIESVAGLRGRVNRLIQAQRLA